MLDIAPSQAPNTTYNPMLMLPFHWQVGSFAEKQQGFLRDVATVAEGKGSSNLQRDTSTNSFDTSNLDVSLLAANDVLASIEADETEPEYLAEDMELFGLEEMSMSMSMSIPSDNGFDCSALQQMW